MQTETPFGFKQPEQSPGFCLWQLSTLWQRQIKKVLKPYDLSHGQFVVLALSLWAQENQYKVYQAWLTQKSKMDKMLVSQATRALSQKGYLKMHPCVSDPRAKSIAVTPAGADLLKKIVPQVEQADRHFFEVFLKENNNYIDNIFHFLNR